MLGMAGAPVASNLRRVRARVKRREVHVKAKIPELDLRTRREWRKWLERNHTSSAGLWLVFHKRHTCVESIDYDESVREALRFGWIDSLVRRLDEDRFARKF